jgi:hypothetical protein
MPTVTSSEVLSLITRVAGGQVVPRMKNPYQHWTDQTVELTADGWKIVLFTDATRSRHLDTVATPDGRRGGYDTWRSDAEFSQQPEDRLNRQDGSAVARMYQAFRKAR